MKEITKEYRIRVIDTEAGHAHIKRVVEEFICGELGAPLYEFYIKEIERGDE